LSQVIPKPFCPPPTVHTFYDLANKIEDNEVDVHDGEYIMLCSNRVLQKLNDIELWQNTDVNGGARMPI
jgi:hypothetical protein